MHGLDADEPTCTPWPDDAIGVCKLSTFFVYLAPGSPPRDISVASQSARELNLMWFPPELRYGVITNYTIIITFTNGTASMTRTSNTASLSISNLQPFQMINVSISARNSKGQGPPLTENFRTNQSSALEGLMHGLIVHDCRLVVLQEGEIRYVPVL